MIAALYYPYLERLLFQTHEFELGYISVALRMNTVDMPMISKLD